MPLSTSPASKCVDDILDKNLVTPPLKENVKENIGRKGKRRPLWNNKDRDQILYRSDPALGICQEIKVDDDMDGEGVKDLKEAKDMIRRLSGETTSKITATKSHFQLSSTAYGVRMLSRDLSNTKVELEVENLLIVTKKHDVSLIYLTRELVEWILIHYPKITVYVGKELKNSKKFGAEDLYKDSKCAERRIKYWDTKFVGEHDNFFDLILTLGGDGTVLFVSSVFQKHVPPVLSFSLGSLGFLTNYQFEYFKDDLSTILNNKIKTNLRMRLECKIYRRRPPILDPITDKRICVTELVAQHHVLNELTIDRGPSPFISMLELYGNKSLLTVAQADGVIIATPTGSTAYSLSAGGPLVYPSVNAITVTPICPHTLSFRPIILPDSMNLKVRVSLKSRATAWAAFDGKGRIELNKGDYITVQASPYSFPTVESHSTEFIDSISRTLNWNVREQQRSFTHMLSRKNQEKYASDTCNTNDVDEDEVEEKVVVGPNIKRTESNALKDDTESEDEVADDDSLKPATSRNRRVSIDNRAPQANFEI